MTTQQVNAAKPKTAPASPAAPIESPRLQKCLQRADDLPDMAAAEANIWIKQGGGHEAHLCRAFAQANRGMHADAAREFWALASAFDKTDAGRGSSMHNLAGREFMLAKDPKNAEGQFATALKMTPHDVPNLIGRAEARMDMERSWDSLDDLNRALKIKPDNVDALRQRGRAWEQLGNPKNAQEDFQHAADVEGNAAAPVSQ